MHAHYYSSLLAFFSCLERSLPADPPPTSATREIVIAVEESQPVSQVPLATLPGSDPLVLPESSADMFRSFRGNPLNSVKVGGAAGAGVLLSPRRVLEGDDGVPEPGEFLVAGS